MQEANTKRKRKHELNIYFTNQIINGNSLKLTENVCILSSNASRLQNGHPEREFLANQQMFTGSLVNCLLQFGRHTRVTASGICIFKF